MARVHLNTRGSRVHLHTARGRVSIGHGLARRAWIELGAEGLGLAEVGADAARQSWVEARSEALGFAESGGSQMDLKAFTGEGPEIRYFTWSEPLPPRYSIVNNPMLPEAYYGSYLFFDGKLLSTVVPPPGLPNGYAFFTTTTLRESGDSPLAGKETGRLEALSFGEVASDSATESHATSDALQELLVISSLMTAIMAANEARPELLALLDARTDNLAGGDRAVWTGVFSEAWRDGMDLRALGPEVLTVGEAIACVAGAMEARGELLALQEVAVDDLSSVTGAPLIEVGADRLGHLEARGEVLSLGESGADTLTGGVGNHWVEARAETLSTNEVRTDAAGFREARAEMASLSEVGADALGLGPRNDWQEALAEYLPLGVSDAREELSEPLALVEAPANVLASIQARTEALALGEARGDAIGLGEARGEALAVGEAGTAALALAAAAAESLGFTEARTDQIQGGTQPNAWTEPGAERLALGTMMELEALSEAPTLTEVRADAVGRQPFIAARGTVSTGTTQTQNVNIPASQSGDILVAIIEERVNADTGSHSVSGWTQQGTTQRIGYSRLSVWWTRSSGTNGTTTVSCSKGSAVNGTMHVLAIRGCVASGSPWDSGSDATLRSCATTGTTVTVPGITTATDRCLVLAVLCHGHATSTAETFTYSSGGVATVNTTVGALQSGSSTTRIAGTIFYGPRAAAGATGNQVFTGSNASAITTTYPCAGMLLALRGATE